MDAVEYLKSRARMTKGCHIGCSKNCPLGKGKDGRGVGCIDMECNNPEESVAIVEQWAKEHPLKTYAQDFFEKFPDAPRRDDGSPKACRCVVYSNNHCKHNGCEVCWNEPMEEGNDETD